MQLLKLKIILFACVISLTQLSCSKNGGGATTDPNTVKINGTVYKTVTVGSQVWTTDNYSGSGGYGLPATDKYGSYYTRSQAIAIVLPAGWRVPTINDFDKLLGNFTTFKDAEGHSLATSAVPPLALCATAGWLNNQGTNTSGFNALPSSYYSVSNGQTSFSTIQSGVYVTADFTVASGVKNQVYGIQIDPSSAGFDHFTNPENQSLSVRFVRDK